MKRTVKLDLLIYNAGKLTYFQDMLVLIVNQGGRVGNVWGNLMTSVMNDPKSNRNFFMQALKLQKISQRGAVDPKQRKRLHQK